MKKDICCLKGTMTCAFIQLRYNLTLLGEEIAYMIGVPQALEWLNRRLETSAKE